jgi:hypothetical protein
VRRAVGLSCNGLRLRFLSLRSPESATWAHITKRAEALQAADVSRYVGHSLVSFRVTGSQWRRSNFVSSQEMRLTGSAKHTTRCGQPP